MKRSMLLQRQLLSITNYLNRTCAYLDLEALALAGPLAVHAYLLIRNSEAGQFPEREHWFPHLVHRNEGYLLCSRE